MEKNSLSDWSQFDEDSRTLPCVGDLWFCRAVMSYRSPVCSLSLSLPLLGLTHLLAYFTYASLRKQATRGSLRLLITLGPF